MVDANNSDKPLRAWTVECSGRRIVVGAVVSADLASITNYRSYLIHRFELTIQSVQLCQFVFFGGVATGTVMGGPVGDRIGRKKVIWAS